MPQTLNPIWFDSPRGPIKNTSHWLPPPPTFAEWYLHKFHWKENRFDEKICCCIHFECNNRAMRTSSWQACEIPLAQLRVTWIVLKKYIHTAFSQPLLCPSFLIVKCLSGKKQLLENFLLEKLLLWAKAEPAWPFFRHGVSPGPRYGLTLKTPVLNLGAGTGIIV